MRPSTSTQAQFRPISPSPPRKVMVTGAGIGRSLRGRSIRIRTRPGAPIRLRIRHMAQTITETRDDSPDREPATPPTPAPPRTRRRVPVVAILGAILVILAVGLVLRLADQERDGPAHLDLSIGDGIPATLYVPEDTVDDEFPLQAPQGERPPLVIIGHGYSADQMIMSSMARSLAEAGYATLTFDFRGHGSNTADFRGDLRDDFAAVVDWAETSPNVDGSRDRGARPLDGRGRRPRLRHRRRSTRSPSSRCPAAGPSTTTWCRRTCCSSSPRTTPVSSPTVRATWRSCSSTSRPNVASAEIGGTDHVTILWSGDTIRQIVGFLDPVFGIERADSDDRRPGRPAAAHRRPLLLRGPCAGGLRRPADRRSRRAESVDGDGAVRCC